MTKPRVPARAVPALQLTEQDELEFRQLRHDLKHELLAPYEAFLSSGSVDTAQWVHAGGDGDLHVYRERTGDTSEQHNYAYVPEPQSTTPRRCPQETMARQLQRPRMLVTGTIIGTVDNAMFASSFQDTASLQANWGTHALPHEPESAVVATLERASLVDPFCFLGVVWSMQPASKRANRWCCRDYVSLVNVELTTLCTGEQVGVVVVHSVTHRGLAEMHEFDTVRATASMLTVFRQVDATRIDVWSVQVDSRPPVLSQAASVCDVGFRKKLAWVWQQRRRSRQPRTAGVHSNGECELCCRSTSRLFARAATACALCDKHVCSRCRVAQHIVQSRHSSPERVECCLACLLDTKRFPARLMAQEQVLHAARTTPRSARR